MPEVAQLLKKGSLLWKRAREESNGGGGDACEVAIPFPRKLGRMEPAAWRDKTIIHMQSLSLVQQGIHDLRWAVERAVRRLCRHEEASILLSNWTTL